MKSIRIEVKDYNKCILTTNRYLVPRNRLDLAEAKKPPSPGTWGSPHLQFCPTDLLSFSVFANLDRASVCTPPPIITGMTIINYMEVTE